MDTLPKVSEVKFLYDIIYEKDGRIVYEQNIFDQIFTIIDQAKKFIFIDMFLFNNEYDRKHNFPQLTQKLATKLISKKLKQPNINIIVVLDEINTFYGSFTPEHIDNMRKSNIEVIIFDTANLKDSNPIYSVIWKIFFQWFGTSGKGLLPNPFSPSAPKVTLRSYLKMLNTKANHRKVVITEKKAVIGSANAHDASAYHCNIAFVVEGEIINDILYSEKAAINISGKDIDISHLKQNNLPANDQVMLLTDGKIGIHLLQAIEKTGAGDSVFIGMFYLSDRRVVNSLLKASNRGTNIRIILDPNKDAFGVKKIGIPNRPVADELHKKTNGAIKIRWYNTHGEQYHTKLTMIKYKKNSVILGGSANLTRRNLGDYTMETDLKINVSNDTAIVKQITQYFNRLWNNSGGVYTTEFKQYRKESIVIKAAYRLQEWTGISAF
ncbi:MAG: phospholipase [Firmicutes bacterium]|nr:phospholipase [Bacillota bacterium]